MHASYLCAENKCFLYPYSLKRSFSQITDYCSVLEPPKSRQFHTDCKYTNKRVCTCPNYQLNLPNILQATQLLSFYFQGIKEETLQAKLDKAKFEKERRLHLPTLVDYVDFTEYLSLNEIKKVQKEVELSKNTCDRCSRIIQGSKKQVKVSE